MTKPRKSTMLAVSSLGTAKLNPESICEIGPYECGTTERCSALNPCTLHKIGSNLPEAGQLVRARKFLNFEKEPTRSRLLQVNGLLLAIIAPYPALSQTAIEPLASRLPNETLTNELSPSELGYVTYDLSASSSGGQSYLGGRIGVGLRLGVHAIDADGMVFALSGSNICNVKCETSSGLHAVINGVAYRRFFFEQRLSLTVGRRYTPSRGLLQSTRVDGIALSRSNINALGEQVYARERLFALDVPREGVLSYRVGNRVLYQTPVRSGPFALDASFLDALPAGGVAELTLDDGRTIAVEPRVSQQSPVSLFAPGTYEFDLVAGRASGLLRRSVPALRAIGRIGVSSDVTIGGGVEVATDVFRGALDIALQLPSRLGYVSIAASASRLGWQGAPQWNALWGTGFFANWQFGTKRFTGSLSGRVNWDSGVPGLLASSSSASSTDQAVARFPADPLISQVRATLSTRVLDNHVGVAVDADHSTYRAGFSSSALGLRLSGVLRPRLSWSVYARGSSFEGRGAWNAGLSLSLPIGRGTNANLSLERQGNSTQLAAQVSGSASLDLDNDFRYNADVDSDGRLAVSAERDFVGFTANMQIGFKLGGGLSGRATLGGGFVVGDRHIVATRNIGDIIVLVKAPGLAGADVFRNSSTRPTSRLDKNGYAALSGFQPYRINPLRVSVARAPIGTILGGNILGGQVLEGTVQPGRGYFVPLEVKTVRPLRIYVDLPASARSDRYAFLGDTVAPVEADGSFYVDDITRLPAKIEIVWRSGRCEINTPSTEMMQLVTLGEWRAGPCQVA